MFKPLTQMLFPKASLLTGTLALSALFSPLSSAYTASQQTYLDAKSALEKGQYTQYRSLRAKLNDYPLAIYLDYNAEIDNVIDMPSSKAMAKIDQYKTLPFYGSARYRYLINAGKKSRWNDFLAVSPNEPNDVRLQCYYYRSLLANNQKDAAYKGAQNLWVYGYSRPNECDPLFDAWTKAGHRTQDIVWARLFAAFESGQTSLFNYLAQKITKQAEFAKRLQSVYNDPKTLRNMKHFRDKSPIVGDIVAAGLQKMAKSDLDEAIKLYVKYQEADRFSDFQGRTINRYLVRRALIRQDDSYKSYVDTFLPLLESDDLFERRLRWAIRDQDHATMTKYIALLSTDTRIKERWQYWLAVLEQKRGEDDAAKQRLIPVSNERNFYGFATAQQLKQDVSLQFIPAQDDTAKIASLKQDDAYLRIVELLALDKTMDARSEWVSLLKRQTPESRAQLGVIAIKNKWHDLAVEASIQAKLWDDVGMRFPFAEQTAFEKASDKFKVNIDEIRAIARRESAFYPYATSAVGARGLMQLMPATAKHTGKKIGLSFKEDKNLYQSTLNVQLGSAYYASLLTQFNNNRVLATAAYNAGPSRVRRWLEQSGGRLDVMSFIETIPYTETREYVQAVLSYRVIYEVRQSKLLPLFSEAERNFAY